MAVHGIGNIGDGQHRQAERFHQLFQLFHIRRGQVRTRQQIDLTGHGFAPLRQGGNNRLHGRRIPFLQRAAVIGGRGVNDRHMGRFGMLLAELDDGAVHIIPHGLGQAGGHHPHHLGGELLDHPGDPLFQVLPAAENGAYPRSWRWH